MSKYLSQAKGAAASMYQATELENKTRRDGNFEATESTLPNIRKAPISEKRSSLASNLLSYLGPYNPIPKSITSNDTVWLLDNTAYRNSQTGQWEAEFVAAVFDQQSGVEISTVVADVAEKLGIGKGDAAEARIQERLMPFVQDILPGRTVIVHFGTRETLRLGPGGRNAISSDIKRMLPYGQGGDVVKVVAKVPQGANGILESKTVYAEPEGWGIISGK
jgi:hypothetical protein